MLNSELQKARQAIYERDVIINQLREQNSGNAQGSASNGAGSDQVGRLSAADRALGAANQAIGGIGGNNYQAFGHNTFGQRPSDQEASWVNNSTEAFDEQMTGASVLSAPYNPHHGGRSVAPDETSDTEMSCTDYSAMETPRDMPPPSYDITSGNPNPITL